ncbi:HNH endonuclease [Paracoccus niistensis]|uniref:HNH endonuclease n=1 Tax=Paracoccus niistensis TaxID=632935 RepID=A0ABV6I3I8_9RHOB
MNIENTSFWWVNNKKTFTQEIEGNYLWSPRKQKGGKRSAFYDNMQRVRPGDVVFVYANVHIRAVGECVAPAVRAPKPIEFGAAGNAWGEDGWLVRVNFTRISAPMRPSDHMQILAPLLPRVYSPIQKNGHGNENAYLAFVPKPMATAVVDLLGPVWREFRWCEPVDSDEKAESQAEEVVRNRTDLTDTDKEQIIIARRGQGIFKTNLTSVEKRCRVTGATHPQHLRASHMKPWRVSTNAERLDGNNGLLLSPHIDHLFDQGFITFEDSGELVISSCADRRTLTLWNIVPPIPVAPFRDDQLPYLRYHREYIFRKQHLHRSGDTHK